MRVGIIGAGSIARVHMAAVRANRDGDLVGVYDVAGDKARAAAEEFDCRPFYSMDALLDAVDGVVIASPNHAHAVQAMDAMRSGRHVLCEKPMSTTLDEATWMSRVAERSGRVCSVGFNYRYLSTVGMIKQMVDARQLGSILFVDLAFKKGSALTRTAFTWRDGSGERRSSGALGDLGVHLIDLLGYLFGGGVEPESVRGKLQVNVPRKQGRRVEVDDYAFISGHLRSGVYFNLTASKSSPTDDQGLSIRVVGDRGELAYHSGDGTEYRVRTRVLWQRRPFTEKRIMMDPPGEIAGWGNTFYHQCADWVAVAASGHQSHRLAGYRDGLASQRVLDAVLTRATLHPGTDPDPYGVPADLLTSPLDRSTACPRY